MSKTYLRVLLAFALAAVAFSAAPSPARAATINVNSTADVVANDGQCTLREAITAANTDTASGGMAGECQAGSGADTIMLGAQTYTLAITGNNEDNNATGDLDIRAGLTIQGQGAGSTIVQAGTTAENGIDRVFQVAVGGIAVSFKGLTIRNGFVSGSGGGVFINFNVEPTVTVVNSVIASNTASAAGGGLAAFAGTVNIDHSSITGNIAGFGGGLSNGGFVVASGGTMNVLDSNISGNQATSLNFGDGGGVLNEATLNMANSTLNGNTAFVDGGGVSGQAGVTNLTNVTILGNTADDDNASDPSGNGGGVNADEGSTVTLKNSLVAQNNDQGGENPDVFGQLASDGFNLIGSVGDTNFSANTAGDQYGDPSGTTMPNTGASESGSPIDPQVAALTGSPAYYPLLNGSPAKDQIPPFYCKFLSSGTNPLFTNGAAVDTDQPGNARPNGTYCDTGAYEHPEGVIIETQDVYLPLLVK